MAHAHLESHDVGQQKQVPPVDGDAVCLHDVGDLLGDDDPCRLHAEGLEHLRRARGSSCVLPRGGRSLLVFPEQKKTIKSCL